MNSLEKEFLGQVKEPLFHLGFKRQSEGIFIFPVNEDFNGWIGLNSSTKYTDLLINPVVGIGSKKIINFFYKIRGNKPTRKIYPVINLPLKSLTNFSYKSNWICNFDDIFIEVKKMTSFINSDAIIYIQKNANFESMLDLMLNYRHGYFQQNIYFIPICYLLLNQNQKAIDYVNIEHEKLKNENHTVAESYKNFYINFLKYLEDGSFPPISQG